MHTSVYLENYSTVATTCFTFIFSSAPKANKSIIRVLHFFPPFSFPIFESLNVNLPLCLLSVWPKFKRLLASVFLTTTHPSCLAVNLARTAELISEVEAGRRSDTGVGGLLYSDHHPTVAK